MNILGIGWEHPSGAALLSNGSIVAAASEERFTRKKNDSTFPLKSIMFCLNVAGGAKNIDAAGIVEQNPAYSPHLYDYSQWGIQEQIREQHEYWYPTLYQGLELDDALIFKDLWNTEQFPKDYWLDYSPHKRRTFADDSRKMVADFVGLNPDQVYRINHHESHALYGLYASKVPRDSNCLVVTIDGSGDGCNATVQEYKNGVMNPIYETDKCVIGRIYSHVTLLLGMKRLEHEYKVMGLAPYGNPRYAVTARKVFEDILEIDGVEFKWKNKPKDSYFHFKEKLEGMRFDNIAAGLQMWVEDVLVEWVQNLVEHTGVKNLVISGGVSMNSKAMGKIAQLDEISNLWVAGSSSDDCHPIGTAIGVQHGLEQEKNQSFTYVNMESLYLGPDAFKSLAFALEKAEEKELDVIHNPDEARIAQLIADGNVFGRCIGRMEFGQRALGNRSIIADPRDSEVVGRINRMIKQRDFWMPFAPVILDSSADELIVGNSGVDGRHMTIVFETTEKGRKVLRGACHPADGTVRAQILERQDNPGFYDLIAAFEKITGVGALLNTSFNTHGEPIVNTSDEALSVFLGSEIDGLILPETMILKNHANRL